MRFNVDKCVELMAYFAEKGNGKIDKLKLLKLVFFADRMHLRNYGRTIVDGTYYGMRRGPVHSEILSMIDQSSILSEDEKESLKRKFGKEVHNLYLKSRGCSVVKAKNEFFSESEIEVIEKIWRTFGDFSQWQLQEITHLYPEWKTDSYLLDDGYNRFDMRMIKAFDDPDECSMRTLKEVYGFESDPFEQDPDVLEYTREQYLYNEQLKSL